MHSKKFKDCYGICCTTVSDCNIYDHSKMSGVDKPVDSILEEVENDIVKQLSNVAAVD